MSSCTLLGHDSDCMYMYLHERSSSWGIHDLTSRMVGLWHGTIRWENVLRCPMLLNHACLLKVGYLAELVRGVLEP